MAGVRLIRTLHVDVIDTWEVFTPYSRLQGRPPARRSGHIVSGTLGRETRRRSSPCGWLGNYPVQGPLRELFCHERQHVEREVAHQFAITVFLFDVALAEHVGAWDAILVGTKQVIPVKKPLAMPVVRPAVIPLTSTL